MQQPSYWEGSRLRGPLIALQRVSCVRLVEPVELRACERAREFPAIRIAVSDGAEKKRCGEPTAAVQRERGPRGRRGWVLEKSAPLLQRNSVYCKYVNCNL